MQPNRAFRRPIIVIDVDEVGQVQQGSLNSRPARQGSLDSGANTPYASRQGLLDTPAAKTGSLDSGVDTPRASRRGSLNPPVAGTGSLDYGSRELPDTGHEPQSKGHSTLEQTLRTCLSKGHSTHQLPGRDHSTLEYSIRTSLRKPTVAGTGSLDSGSVNPRAARQEARSAEQWSLDPAADTPHASQHGSFDPPVAVTNHSTLDHSTSALPGTRQDLQSKGHSTLGYSTRTRLRKGHSTHQLLGQDHSTLGHSTSALHVHGPMDRACHYIRRHRKQQA